MGSAVRLIVPVRTVVTRDRGNVIIRLFENDGSESRVVLSEAKAEEFADDYCHVALSSLRMVGPMS